MRSIPHNIEAYDNAKVRTRFGEYYDLSEGEVDKIFTAMKVFLFVSHRYMMETGKRLRIVDETFVIDEMWHNFVLFTEDYHAFCHEMFGEFYHHTPAVTNVETISIDELSEQLQFIQAYVGEDRLETWYSTWAKTYNAREMHKKRILPEIEFEPAEAE